jgi:exopolysaccharide/PEP-CTERM locus tyrosine autokinase
MDRLIEALARAKQEAASEEAQARDAAESAVAVEDAPAAGVEEQGAAAAAQDVAPGIGSATERIALMAAASVSGPHLHAASSFGDTVVPFAAPRSAYDPVLQQPINPRAARSLEDVEARQAANADLDEGVFAEPPRVAPPARDLRDGGAIVYSKTRQHMVSAEFFRTHRVIAGFEQRGVADAYKILSTQVLQRMRENGWNALAVVSPGSREGKTLTAVNLAISLAREASHTVLLVDADLRHPCVHEYFNMPAEPGLTDHLLDGVPLEAVLVNPGIEKFVVLPGGRAMSSSSELLGSQKMFTLVTELKRRYPSRIIVFDLPPVLSTADALAFAPHVDASVMVVEEGRTDTDDVLRAAELLESANLIGTVLNNSRAVGLAEGGRPQRRAPAGEARNEPRLDRVPDEAGQVPAPSGAASPQASGFWRRLFARRG